MIFVMNIPGALILISLCGVFGILVIPIMQRVLYQHLIQFLIALAVGTLTGDALLHLLPHAFLAKMSEAGHEGHHGHNHHQHEQAVWLGFTGLVAMIGFFLFEKIINVIGKTHLVKQRQSLNELICRRHEGEASRGQEAEGGEGGS